jgi:hypothetical protein
MVRLHSFDQHHFGFSGAMADFARPAVFFAIEPLFRALHRFELQNYDALWLPVALQGFDSIANGDIFPAVLFDNWNDRFLYSWKPTGSRMSISTIR